MTELSRTSAFGPDLAGPIQIDGKNEARLSKRATWSTCSASWRWRCWKAAPTPRRCAFARSTACPGCPCRSWKSGSITTRAWPKWSAPRMPAACTFATPTPTRRCINRMKSYSSTASWASGWPTGWPMVMRWTCPSYVNSRRTRFRSRELGECGLSKLPIHTYMQINRRAPEQGFRGSSFNAC